jgi:hypothetical protein
MPRITIGEQMVHAFVELGEDIDAIVDEIRHSLDAKAFPTNNSINEAHRCNHIFARCIGTTRRRV